MTYTAVILTFRDSRWLHRKTKCYWFVVPRYFFTGIGHTSGRSTPTIGLRVAQFDVRSSIHHVDSHVATDAAADADIGWILSPPAAL